MAEMRIPLPQDVAFILDRLNKNGYEGYIVGGCVRDHFLGRVVSDYDITTNALPEAVTALFAHTIPTGEKHGTITVLMGKNRYEVTTFRVDGEYMDNRRPESVSFTSDLQLDLSRRDFTINAIAYNEEKGTVDPFSGKQDLANRLVRGVGIPEERFQEDALRMMRAVRFSAQLGFEIEQETLEAVCSQAKLINNISAERIRDEFTKTLMSKTPAKILLYWETGLMPELWRYKARVPGPDAFRQASDALERLQGYTTDMAYAALMRGYSFDQAYTAMDKFRFDKKTSKRTALLVDRLEDELKCDALHVRRFMAKCGAENFMDIVSLKYAFNDIGAEEAAHLEAIYNEIIDARCCLTLKELAINGDRLIAMGYKGERLGEVLQYLLGIVVDDPSMNTAAVLEKEALLRSQQT